MKVIGINHAILSANAMIKREQPIMSCFCYTVFHGEIFDEGTVSISNHAVFIA